MSSIRKALTKLASGNPALVPHVEAMLRGRPYQGRPFKLTPKELSRADSSGWTMVTRPQAGGGWVVAAVDVSSGMPWGGSVVVVEDKLDIPGAVKEQLRMLNKMGWDGMADASRHRNFITPKQAGRERLPDGGSERAAALTGEVTKYAYQDFNLQLGLYVRVKADRFVKSKQGMAFSGTAKLYPTADAENRLISAPLDIAYKAVLDAKTGVFTVKSKTPFFEEAIRRVLAQRKHREDFDHEGESLGLPPVVWSRQS